MHEASLKIIRIICGVLGLLCWNAIAERPCVLTYLGLGILVAVWLKFERMLFPRKQEWVLKTEQMKKDIPEFLRQESKRLAEDLAAHAAELRQDHVREMEEKRLESQRAKIRKDDEKLAKCICAGTMPFSDFVRNVRNGDGHAYEERLKKFFERLDMPCEGVSNSADQGVDLIVEKNGHRIAIQCKYYQHTVGNSAVQEAFAGREYYACEESWVVSNAKFTRSAKDLAEAVHVILVEQEDLVSQMKRSGLL